MSIITNLNVRNLDRNQSQRRPALTKHHRCGENGVAYLAGTSPKPPGYGVDTCRSWRLWRLPKQRQRHEVSDATYAPHGSESYDDAAIVGGRIVTVAAESVGNKK